MIPDIPEILGMLQNDKISRDQAEAWIQRHLELAREANPEMRDVFAGLAMQGCDYCNHALYAGAKCKNCGRTTEQAQKQEPVADEVGTGCECANCANGMGLCHTIETQAQKQEPVREGLALKIAMGEANDKRLEAQKQEPVAVVDANDDGYWAEILPDRNVKVGQFLYTSPPSRQPEPVIDKSAAIRIATALGWTPPKQEQGEPVGEVINERGDVDYISYVPPIGTNLYTTPQQRKPLTDEQIFNVISSTTAGDTPYSYRIARAIEAAHGIKGEA